RRLVKWSALVSTLSATRQTGYATVHGLRLYYEVHGAAVAGRAPLVLVHGGGSTLDTSFGALLPAIARSRQVVAFDQQGHGRTEDADRPFSFPQSADDAVALIQSLDIDRADFMGYSNGGHIAIEIAIRHPAVVRRLVIESAMFDRSGADPQFWAGFEGARLESMPEDLQRACLATA